VYFVERPFGSFFVPRKLLLVTLLSVGITIG
jgi:hypothetical protein